MADEKKVAPDDSDKVTYREDGTYSDVPEDTEEEESEGSRPEQDADVGVDPDEGLPSTSTR